MDIQKYCNKTLIELQYQNNRIEDKWFSCVYERLYNFYYNETDKRTRVAKEILRVLNNFYQDQKFYLFSGHGKGWMKFYLNKIKGADKLKKLRLM